MIRYFLIGIVLLALLVAFIVLFIGERYLDNQPAKKRYFKRRG